MDLQGSTSSFLKIGPQLARIMRVLRVSRLFKLMKSKQLQGLNRIIKTLIFSFPSLMNVFLLLFLLYFIFAVLSVFLFKTAKFHPEFNNELYNFRNFHSAFYTLFRASTGEDWHMFMFTLGENEGMFVVARIFFIFFYFLASMIMLKVFQLVVMQEFDEFFFNPNNALNSFDDIKDVFLRTWNKFTLTSRGERIKENKLVDFFYTLE
jgi:hypothetical protein